MAVPADLANKRVWLRAKDLGAGGSSVTTWADQSGQGNDATAPDVPPTVAASSTPSGGKSVAFAGLPLNLTAAPNVPSPIASAAASSAPIGGFEASKAIDGNRTGTRWLGSDPSIGTPQWLRLTLTSATVVTYYKLWGHASNTAYNPTDWKFQGTNDGTFATWTDLDTRSGVTWASASEAKEFTFANSTAYLYYRILITANVSATDFVAISEIIVRPDPVAELWVVVKATDQQTRPWQFGASSQATFYPVVGGNIVENFGVTTHSGSFTPTMAVVSNWRIYRVKLKSGQMEIWLDNVLQKTTTALVEGWDATPNVSLDFAGNIAELLVTYGDELTSGDIAGLITYFNTEHGLTVPGGSASSPSGPVEATLPALTASAAGTVETPPVTGTVAAVLPPLSASITGTGPAPTTGFVAAVLPKLSASITGDVSEPAEPVTGFVAAVLPPLSASITDGDAGEPTQTLEGGFAFGSILTTSTVALQQMAGGFAFGSRLKQARTWSTDPRSTRPSPRVVIAERDGTPVMALGNVAIGELTFRAVGLLDSWRFSVDRDDPAARIIDPVTHEAHLYRGSVLMSKGPLTMIEGLDRGRLNFQVQDPRWYLYNGRRIGRVPKLDWCFNGDFSLGTQGWHGAYSPGSIPETAPEFSVVDEVESTSGKGLRIEGVDKVVTNVSNVETAAVFVPNEATYLSGGASLVIAAAADIPDGATIHVVGHTADRRAYGDPGDGLELSLARAQAAKATLAAHNATWTFTLLPGLRSPNENDGVVAGRGYYEQVAPNSNETDSAKNRRVALHYTSTQTAAGHKQFVYQYEYNVVNDPENKVPLTVTVAGRMRIGEWLGAPADGWALWIGLYDSNGDLVGDPGTATMDEATPRQRWFDYSASVDVPPDGETYRIGWRLYPPAGWAVWVDIGVYPEEQLGFFDVDQAHIVRDLTEHVQDPAMGKGDLGIGTRTPATGITRTREYPFHERRPYGTAIEELVALARGVEVDFDHVANAVVTYYPRQGSTAGLPLAHGGQRSIVKAYRPLPARGSSLASSVIAQAWGISVTRLERYARDEAAFGGALLEAVIEADGESPPVELQELADQSLARSVHPRAAWELVLDPARTSEVLDDIGKGDSTLVSLPDEGAHGLRRLVQWTWNPETDGLTVQASEEA